MPYGYGYGKKKGGILKPCLTGQTYWSSVLADGLFTDKDTTRGNDAVLYSNALYLTAKSESIFLNDVLMYISKIDIRHSADNVTWSVWETGDVAILNLFNIDEATRTFTLCDGLIQYVSDIIFYTNIEGVDTQFLKWINSSNDNDVDYNIIGESEWAGKQFPFNKIISGVILQTGLTL